MLSMVETAIRISGDTISIKAIDKIISLGKELLEKPIELLDGVKEVLKSLSGKYQLVIATKGDLLDQERKLEKSKLGGYFNHVEIMSDKKESDYLKLMKQLVCDPDSFMMIGNSIKSDIMPVLNIGGYAVHVPYHTTWAHEHIDHDISHDRFSSFENIRQVIPLFK